ncbi:MAG: hypothetical protein ACI9RV_002853, partial [Glaciecola sp.]
FVMIIEFFNENIDTPKVYDEVRPINI